MINNTNVIIFSQRSLKRKLSTILCEFMNSRIKQQGTKSTKTKAQKSKEGTKQAKAKSEILLIPNTSNHLPTDIPLTKQSLPKIKSTTTKTTKIVTLLKQCSKKPGECLKELLRNYGQSPNTFTEYLKLPLIQNEARLIFEFAKVIIQHYDHFFQQQKFIQIFQHLLKLINDRFMNTTPQELAIIEKTTNIMWQKIRLVQFDLFLQSCLKYYLKIAIALGRRIYHKEQHQVSQRLISNNIKNLIIEVQNRKNKHKLFRDIFNNFYNQSFQILTTIASKSCYIIPLFDIASLSLLSPHSQLYRNILLKTLDYLKAYIQQKKQQQFQQDQKSVKQSQHIIRILFLTANIFNFTSIFSQNQTKQSQSKLATIQSKLYYTKQIVFLVMYLYKQHFIKLVDQLQKIEKNSIPKQIIRALFQLTTFGNSINRPQTLKQILSKIMSSPTLKKHFNSPTSSIQPFQSTVIPNQNTPEQQIMDNLVKSMEKSLFELLYKIQKTLCHYNLTLYMDLYIQNPQTLRSQYFIQNLYQQQHSDIILQFMIAFTKRWILAELKQFDFHFYLTHFLKKCIGKDTLNYIGRYVKGLQVEELLKINLIIYKISFEEDKKKLTIPDPPNEEMRLAHLTAVGFADKFLLINKIMPNFSQQLLWRQIINNFFPSQNYIYVKAFYHVINYQLNFSNENLTKIQKIIDQFVQAVSHLSMQQTYSIFHLLACVFYRNQAIDQPQYINKERCLKTMLSIVLQKHNQLINICDTICERRRNAMSHMVLMQQMVNENYKYFQKSKRMHAVFIKTLTHWMQRLHSVQKLVPHSTSYEKTIQIYQKISKDIEYPQFHFLRALSHFCSQKYFANILQKKIKKKALQNQIISMNNLLLLRQLIFNLIQKYPTQNNFDQYCFSQAQIIQYLQIILISKLSVNNQRQLLKEKLIVLQIIFQLTEFFIKFHIHKLASFYHKFYHTSLKLAVIQIAVQNPDLTSKYQRQLIIHLRISAIKQIIHFYNTPFQVLCRSDLFAFVYELCYDKLIQVRFMIMNLLISRFKSQQYQHFLTHKYQIITYMTIFSIFQPHLLLNTTAKRVVQTYKKAGNQQGCLALTVFLYSIKGLLNDIRNSIRREDYHICVDLFLKTFDQIWMAKKQWQYSVYAFCLKYIDQQTITFLTQNVSYRSHIQTYIIARQKSDFVLENQIKQYMKKEKQFSFEFPPDEPQIDQSQRYIKNVVETLPFRIFNRLKQIVICKQRNTRIIRFKKDIKINWAVLQKQSIVKHHKELYQNFDLIQLTMI